MSDLFDISGKRALVTGGSSGIGTMIARGFVQAGVHVTISSRKADVCEQVAAELDALGPGTCDAVPADLSSEDECRRLAEVVTDAGDRLHILVNNAGVTWGVPMAEHDTRSWRRVLDVNVEAVFHTTKFLRPLLEAASTDDDPARVINIGSIDGLRAPAMETFSYGASKAAVHHLTRHLAKHLAPSITVNAIAPGPFRSRMMKATLDAFEDGIARSAPMGRIGHDEDMAGAARFLASRAASYVTGAVLPVDGGISTTG